MLSLDGGHRIWLCARPTDMRRSFDGLSALVRNELGADPTSGNWYTFVNRRRTIVKILAFDGDGYWIWSKRLEAGRFATRGETRSGKVPLNRTTLLALIEGTDIEVKRQRKRYRKGVTSKPFCPLLEYAICPVS